MDSSHRHSSVQGCLQVGSICLEIRDQIREGKMANRVNHQEVVKKLLDAKAIDFGAIGKVVAELGPVISLADEPWENFCTTMRRFIHIFIIHSNVINPVENLGELRSISGELKG